MSFDVHFAVFKQELDALAIQEGRQTADVDVLP